MSLQQAEVKAFLTSKGMTTGIFRVLHVPATASSLTELHQSLILICEIRSGNQISPSLWQFKHYVAEEFTVPTAYQLLLQAKDRLLQLFTKLNDFITKPATVSGSIQYILNYILIYGLYIDFYLM